MNFETAEIIRARYKKERITQKQLSIEYGVSDTTICRIVNNETFLKTPSTAKKTHHTWADTPDRDRNKIENGFSKDSKIWGKLLYAA